MTGNGITLAFVDGDEGDFAANLLAWLFASDTDTVDDTVAEHALDVVCFLQDEDVQTPMDALVSYPISMTTTDLDLE